ncbi:unnamed protein product [Nezara viridula]|uniref:C2H2-type domain-containing protein n=1 Tax=Nezara viridula TaxID=85310 RepID=A0A9P0E7B8_NEZVI|nr:unnamed protein product [Nezara viridula]
MDISNPYITSFWKFLVHSHSKEELKQINNYLTVFLALSTSNCREENGQSIYKCRGCPKSYSTVLEIIKHLHIVHSSELYETCKSDKQVLDLTE